MQAAPSNGGSEPHAGQRAVTSAGCSAEVQVLTNVPNIIGYIRLSLLAAAEVALAVGQPASSLALYLASLVLDALDGIAARRLDQQSAFGAFLDVAIDNLTRAALWSRAFPGLLGVLVPALESTCFVVTHKAGGKAWKDGCFKDAPPWVSAVMARNFKTPLGAWVVAGLMGLPLWCWARRVIPGHPLGHPVIGLALAIGRAIGASVEGWLLERAFRDMLRSDAADLLERKGLARG